jgi:Tfp pilus assembly pilus retraction ATPase PilT
VDRILLPASFAPLLPDDTRRIACELLELAGLPPKPHAFLGSEIPLSLADAGRLRVNIFRQRGSFGVIVHCLQNPLLSLTELGLDDSFRVPLDATGVLLLGGEQRHALLSALIDDRNHLGPGHLVLLQERTDPLHSDIHALITQQEVGQDVQSFAAGVRAADNLDPDWIALGEVPDAETAEAVMSDIAEGRLLVLSIPEEEPAAVIEHFVSRFNEDRRGLHRARLAELLRGVVCLGASGPSRLGETEAQALAWRRQV